MKAKYLFADICVEAETIYGFTPKKCEPYRVCDDRPADISVTITQEEIDAEKANVFDPSLYEGYTDGMCEFMLLYRRICEQLPAFDAMLLHCAAVAVDNRAYLFSAVSGTGKTTHIMQWRKLLGDKVTVVNGDKPIIRKMDGVFYVCGTPWAGKEDWQTPINVPIAAICEVTRAKENSIRRMNVGDMLPLLLNQTLRPEDGGMMLSLLSLLDELVTQVPLYRLGCNISVEAAQVSYGAMSQTEVETK